MSFTESSTVENLIRDLLGVGVTHDTAVGPSLARRNGKVSGLGWHYLAPANVPRQPHEVFVEHRMRTPRALGTRVAADFRINTMEAFYG